MMDMPKVYDIVEWSFLFQVFQLIGLPWYFIEMIRACVYPTSIGVSINEDVDGRVCPEKELRL